MSARYARRVRGFTLIEMIGVLAILASIAAVMTPAVVRSVDDAFADAERRTLATLAAGLRASVERNQSVPAASGWVAAIAAQVGAAPAQIARNERGRLRGYYADPRFLTTTDTAFGGYVQGSGLASAPPSPRILLVSNLTADAPAAPATSAAFDAIWNQSAGAAVTEGTKVFVERIHLAAAFEPVLLANDHAAAAGYRFGSAGPFALASGGTGITRWLIAGTTVDLYAAPFPAGALERRILVTGSRELAYVSTGGAAPTWSWSTQ
ncbi:MAG: type II secretion system protein [Gammaproteobacteria bacterium]